MSAATVGCMSADARSRVPSELAILAATELQLDRALEAARAEATALVEAARGRAGAAGAALADAIASGRAQITADTTGELAAQRDAITEAARAEIARYEAVRGDALAAVARSLAASLAGMAGPEASPS